MYVIFNSADSLSVHMIDRLLRPDPARGRGKRRERKRHQRRYTCVLEQPKVTPEKNVACYVGLFLSPANIDAIELVVSGSDMVLAVAPVLATMLNTALGCPIAAL